MERKGGCARSASGVTRSGSGGSGAATRAVSRSISRCSTGGCDMAKKASAEGPLRVRMYRVGFGDFFLLTVPSKAGPQHVLIDCGVTKGKTGKGDIGTIKAAVADMAKET